MKLISLILNNFKNQNRKIDFSHGINIITGPNGSGKTNILEAIYFLARAKPLRNTFDKELVGWNADVFFTRVRADAQSDKENKTHIKFEGIIGGLGNRTQTSFFINERKIPKARFLNALPLVIFSPKDMDFIDGPPENRRREMDEFLTMVYPELYSVYKDYSEILRQRNKLLKKLQGGLGLVEELEYWNEGLVKNGAVIISARLELLKNFLPFARILAEELFHEPLEGLEFKYISKLLESDGDNLEEISKRFQYKILTKNEVEIEAGMTLYGPQRDDLEFIMNFESNNNRFSKSSIKKANIQVAGSRGQQRLISLIFKFAAMRYYAEKFKEKPVFLLDDPFSELDQEHIKNLVKTLNRADAQIILTGTEIKSAKYKFAQGSLFTVIG